MKKNTTIILILATILLGLVAVFSAIRLAQIGKTPVAPNAPGNSGATTTIACQTLSFTISSPTPTPTTEPDKANLGDFVWEDTNKNGIQDTGENGIPNVTVRLYNTSNTLLSTTITDSNGKYAFTNLDAGNYIVEFVAPSGYQRTLLNAGGNDTKDSDANVTTGKTATINLSAGETDNSVDSGMYVLTGSLGDFVWQDTNKNGIQDSGEPAVPGVTVKLYSGSTLLDTMLTDQNGKYLFTNLNAGTYKVVFSLPSGYSYTTPKLGSNGALDSDANTVGEATVTLAAGQTDLDTDMGIIIGAAKLGDRVWIDDNKNGIQDSGEQGLANVTVRLYGQNGSTITSTTTNTSGMYIFDELVPGNYSLEFILPSGYAFTSQNQGTDDAKDSDVDTNTGKTVQTALTAFEEDLTWDAGVYSAPTKAALGDRVWEDQNVNGIQDTNENGVSGVTVNLLNSGGTVIGTTTTQSNGYYGFSNLDPGTYMVEFVKPSGYKFTQADQGSDNNKDSDANGSNGKTTTITLTAGQADYSWDAGLVVEGTGGTPTPTPTPTGTPGTTATPRPSSTATANPTKSPIAMASPTATPASLPNAGVGTPTIIGGAVGVMLLIGAIVLLGI